MSITIDIYMTLGLFLWLVTGILARFFYVAIDTNKPDDQVVGISFVLDFSSVLIFALWICALTGNPKT